MPLTYTRIPTEWIPTAPYQISMYEWLIPADYALPDGRQHGSLMNHVLFVSDSAGLDEHIKKLAHWIVFHAFLTDPSGLVHVDDTYALAHRTAATLADIPATPAGPNLAADFDHVGQAVYFPHQATPDICYRDTYGKYGALAGEQRDKLINWLLDFGPVRRVTFTPILNESYWQIAKDYAVIESVVGHPPECPNHRANCGECGRPWSNHYDWRAGSVAEWRLKRLWKQFEDEDLARKYEAVIDVGHKVVRNRTAHGGGPPTAEWAPQDTPHEVWDLGRSKEAYKEDVRALFSLMNAVRKVARYLLLDHLFGFGFFPPPPQLETMAFKVRSVPGDW